MIKNPRKIYNKEAEILKDSLEKIKKDVADKLGISRKTLEI